MKCLRVILAALLCAALCLPAAMADPGSSYSSGYAETPVDTATISQLTNIYLAASAIDGYEMEYGERFSFNQVVGERSAAAGYQIAVNGRGVRVRGGGVSQVATTLLLALEDFGWMDVDDYIVYGDKFTGDYVDDPDKAIVTDYANGRDLAFESLYPGTVAIEAWVANNKLCVALTGYNGGSSDPAYMSEAIGTTPMPKRSDETQNVRLASSSIDGYELSYGEKFSFNGVVGPRTAEAGFVNALNGRGVRVCGGGVAQVASTIYLAAKQMDTITLDRVRTYGDRYTGTYVKDPDDAVITDYNAGIDFSFTYYGNYTLHISVYENEGYLVCEIYEIDYNYTGYYTGYGYVGSGE